LQTLTLYGENKFKLYDNKVIGKILVPEKGEVNNLRYHIMSNIVAYRQHLYYSRDSMTCNCACARRRKPQIARKNVLLFSAHFEL